MKKLIIPCLILSLLGCAATKKDSGKEIRIDSNVIGAIVEADGIEIGRTPFVGKINRGIEKIIVKTDYEFSDIQIDKKKHGGMIFGADAQGLGVTSNGIEGAVAVSSIGGVIILGTVTTSAATSNKSSNKKESCDSRACNIIGVVFLAAYLGFKIYQSQDGSTSKNKSSSAWEYSPSQYYVSFKQESDSSDIDFINDVVIRYFSTVNHSQIAIDADGGEYSGALSELMGAKKDKETALRDIHDALEESNGDQVSFANALVERFHR